MLVTVYIDESGTHAGSPVMVLGGRIAKLGQWIDFDKKWRRLLRTNDLKYAHSTELRKQRGEFAGWSASQCDDFVTEAHKIIGRHTLCGFAITLDHDDYQKVYRAAKRPPKLKIDSKYGLCFRVMLMNVMRWIKRSLPDGNHEIHFVLENGDPGSGDAQAILNEAKKTAPDDLRDMLRTLTYGEKARFPGLQAADFVSTGAFHREQESDPRLIRLPEKHVIRGDAKLVSYKSPVLRLEITPAVMNFIVENGIADIEERKRFWIEGRKSPIASVA